MPLRFDLYRRLEPRRPGGDLDAGFRAEVHDPAWFLAKQWQMGEHQGEDAGSPVNVSYVASQVPIDPYGGDPRLDPRITPPEAIIESEPDEWWTVGRRIRIGLAAATLLPGGLSPEADAALRLGDLAPPYDRCSHGYDGLVCYRQRTQLGLPDALFAGVPATQPADLWDPAELSYSAQFTTGNGTGPVLAVPRHDGGDLDWFSIQAGAATSPPSVPAPVDVLPARLKYPGAPNPRLWQIEDAHVDLGGFPPDRSHMATMLLIDLVVSHADDWFTFPFKSTVANVVTLHSVEVRDSFGDVTALQPPADWSLFAVSGLAPTALVIWPTVATPINGPALDDVVVGVDEDANLLWAVERRAGGRELAPPPLELPGAPPPPATGPRPADARKQYAYQPSTYVPPYWHPYQIHEIDGRRRFVQGRLANLQTRPPTLMPEPVSTLLADPKAPPQGPVHQIEPAAIPTDGIRLERRYVLGRAGDGQPVLWLQRRRVPLLGPPISNLRFDVVEETVNLS